MLDEHILDSALQLIGAPFLLHTPGNQLDYLHREYLSKQWLPLADLLYIHGIGQEDTSQVPTVHRYQTTGEAMSLSVRGPSVGAAGSLPAVTLRGLCVKEQQLSVLQEVDNALMKKKRDIEAGWQIENDNAIDEHELC